MSIREVVYGTLALAAAAVGWYHNLEYLQQPDAGWIDWIRQCLVNPATRSALADLSFAYLIINLWMVIEAQRLSMRWAWIFVPITVFVSLGFGVGLFLLFRERRLRESAIANPLSAA